MSSSLLKMGPIACPGTSVQNYHSTLRNIPEETTFHEDVEFTTHVARSLTTTGGSWVKAV
jgi:hypothetical protein